MASENNEADSIIPTSNFPRRGGEMGEREFKHKRPLVALNIGNTVSLVLCVLVNALGNKDTLPGVFVSSTGNVSNSYYLNITPAGWTFSIWGFIYTAQFLYAGYTLSLICRKGPENYLYISPEDMIPPAVYICYIIANCGNITWIFLWDREIIIASGIIIALMALALILATVFSMWGLFKVTPELRANKQNKEIWLNRILVQNSLSFYATWVSIATLLNFAMILSYRSGVDQNDASTTSLGILSLDLVVWFIVDIFLAFRYSNYVIMPYVVFIVALAGSLSKNFEAWSRNSIFSVVLIVVAAFAFLVKLVVMFWRHFRMRPNSLQEAPKE